MAKTRGGEKRKIVPKKKAAAESSSQQSLRDEATEYSTIQEEEADEEITPAPGGKVTAPPSAPATLVNKTSEKPTETHTSDKEEEESGEVESPLRKRL